MAKGTVQIWTSPGKNSLSLRTPFSTTPSTTSSKSLRQWQSPGPCWSLKGLSWDQHAGETVTRGRSAVENRRTWNEELLKKLWHITKPKSRVLKKRFSPGRSGQRVWKDWFRNWKRKISCWKRSGSKSWTNTKSEIWSRGFNLCRKLFMKSSSLPGLWFWSPLLPEGNRPRTPHESIPRGSWRLERSPNAVWPQLNRTRACRRCLFSHLRDFLKNQCRSSKCSGPGLLKNLKFSRMCKFWKAGKSCRTRWRSWRGRRRLRRECSKTWRSLSWRRSCSRSGRKSRNSTIRQWSCIPSWRRLRETEIRSMKKPGSFPLSWKG